MQVQGTINGIGERCGNADLVSIVANLALKLPGHAVAKAAESYEHIAPEAVGNSRRVLVSERIVQSMALPQRLPSS